MPPKTKMTPNEVLADLQERELVIDNTSRRGRYGNPKPGSNADITRNSNKDDTPLKIEKPTIDSAWGKDDMFF